MKKFPDWWPPNPYPEDIFTMTKEEAAKRLPLDPMERTAIAGALGRYFWEIASLAILEKLIEMEVRLP